MRTHFKTLCLLACSLGMSGARLDAQSAALPTGSPSAKADGWVEIFNGRTLDGWVAKVNHHPLGENYLDLFSVRDGAITVSYSKFPARFNAEFGHLFYKIPYSSYRLKLDYKFDGADAAGVPPWALGNSGVMFHSQPPETIGKDQPYPISVEVQLLAIRPGAARRTGSLCTPGTVATIYGRVMTEHCADSLVPARPNGVWVHLEVEVHADGRVSHYIDGELAMQYEKPQLDNTDMRVMEYRFGQNVEGPGMLTKGYIALQAESAPIQFRNIAIKPLAD